MAIRLALVVLAPFLFTAIFWAQQPAPATLDTAIQAANQAASGNVNPNAPVDDTVWVCPMDPDVRSSKPGECPRCGMKLANGIPDPVEYHMDVEASPRPVKTGQKTNLAIHVHDPWKDNPVKNFQVVHEKLFHLFLISQDMSFFVHDHPVQTADGEFHYSVTFPKTGMYRALGDFYPDGATPQLIPATLFVSGTPQAPPKLSRDYEPKNTENMQVSLVTDPPVPIAGMKTQLHFRVNPGEGLEKLLGAWGHVLAASDDLIDLIHTHPFIADGGPQIQFNVVFPRARAYRVWVQFQRQGKVNTAHFDIPVEELH
jgi:hypothetical protein